MEEFNMKIIFLIIPLIVGISSILNIYGQQEQATKGLFQKAQQDQTLEDLNESSKK